MIRSQHRISGVLNPDGHFVENISVVSKSGAKRNKA
ncbi:uncharacterized protein RAG0_00530 [Rhynchosporium agropyri]|uniref:Uncharacterized protein n=2 Tax=Rhynchosporium TaxID=38037 RepID=A0A1E1JTM9_9HELO|nr:uncharacterized protein RCO7_14119 [Rhynchosporium commune]CZS89052.1 uncharacterized protein RAG0_00530 [Rhynchosporium agropyri]